MMIDMRLHAVEWCPHGHPIAILRSDGEPRYVAVAVSVEEAQALSPFPSNNRGAQVRLCGLLQVVLSDLGAQLRGITLDITANNVLRACLWLEGPQAALSIGAQATDGLVLARLHDLPVRMAEADLARVCFRQSVEPAAHGTTPCNARIQPASPDPLAPFRSVIDGLDFGDDASAS
jgi:bifunctional DNase/RNase